MSTPPLKDAGADGPTIDGSTVDELTLHRRAIGPFKVVLNAMLREKDWFASGKIHLGENYKPTFQSGPGNSGTTTYSWAGAPDVEAQFTSFGEVAAQSYGTRLGADGDFTPGFDVEGVPKVIDDGTTIRNIIMVARPFKAPILVAICWDDQLAEFEAINKAASDTADVAGIINRCEDGKSCLLQVVTDPLYTVVKREDKEPLTKVTQPLLETALALKPGEDVLSNENVGKLNTSLAAEELRGCCVVEEGSTYPVGVLSDHVGSTFQHKLSEVVQLNILDKAGKLVPPWDMCKQLRPGTLVTVKGTIKIWHFPHKNPEVQYVAHCIKIIDESLQSPEFTTALPALGLSTTPKQLESRL